MQLRLMNEQQIRALYETSLRRDFPPFELKSLSAILTPYHRHEYDVIGAYENGTLTAYALLYRPEGERSVLLDYLAVLPGYRGRGVGTALLGELRRHYAGVADVLMIECERPKSAPDEAEARKRIHFYTQAGAQLTSVRIWLFAVEYSILVLSCTAAVRDCNWAEKMLALYQRMLPEELYKENVRLLRE